jgi:hypothetical protein
MPPGRGLTESFLLVLSSMSLAMLDTLNTHLHTHQI